MHLKTELKNRPQGKPFAGRTTAPGQKKRWMSQMPGSFDPRQPRLQGAASSANHRSLQVW